MALFTHTSTDHVTLADVLKRQQNTSANFFDSFVLAFPVPASVTNLNGVASNSSPYTVTEYTHISQPNVTWGFTGGEYISFAVVAYDGTSYSAPTYTPSLNAYVNADIVLTWSPVAGATSYSVYGVIWGSWVNEYYYSSADYPVAIQQAGPAGFLASVTGTTYTWNYGSGGNGAIPTTTTASSNFVDSMLIAGHHSLNPSDALTPSDITATHNIHKTFIENYTLIESFTAPNRARAKSLSDTITLIELAIKKTLNSSHTFLEPYTLVENFVHRATLHVPFSEATTMADSLYIGAAHSKLFTDLLILSENFAKGHGVPKSFAETLTLNETVKHTLSPLFFDGFTIFENFKTKLLNGLNFTEHFILLDSVVENAGRAKTLTDLIVLGSTESISKGSNRGFTDQLGVFDYYGDYVQWFRILTDHSTTTDTITFSGISRRYAVFDALTLGDSLNKQITRVSRDTLPVLEDFDPELTQDQNLLDSINVFDAVFKGLKKFRFTDLISLVDSIAEALQQTIHRTFIDILTLLDILTSQYAPAPPPFIFSGVAIFYQLYDRAGFDELRFTKAISSSHTDATTVYDGVNYRLPLFDVVTIAENLAVNGNPTGTAHLLTLVDPFSLIESLVAANRLHFRLLTDEITIKPRDSSALTISSSRSILLSEIPLTIVESTLKSVSRRETDTAHIVEALVLGHKYALNFMDSTTFIEILHPNVLGLAEILPLSEGVTHV